ncbi:unnamed protein product [Alopecurus aequalis]
MSQTQRTQPLPQQSPGSGFSGGSGAGGASVFLAASAMGAAGRRRERWTRGRAGAGKRGGIGEAGTRSTAASMRASGSGEGKATGSRLVIGWLEFGGGRKAIGPDRREHTARRVWFVYGCRVNG